MEQGDKEKGLVKYQEVRKMLMEDEASGHLVSLEMAKLYTKMNRLDEAEKYALQEYKIRPNNIEVNKELAWIAYLKKNTAKAKKYLQVAKSTNSNDPELLARAAKIERS